MSTVPAIHREILVDADPDTAFEVFTARIARWWPLAELSVYGAGATVTFDGRQIVERAPDGMAAAQQWLVRTWDTVLGAYAAEVARQPARQPRSGP